MAADHMLGRWMDKLDEYLNDLRKLRRGRTGDIPTFSIKDGGTKGKVLFLFQDPGNSGAADSGVVDRDNKDESAKLFIRLSTKNSSSTGRRPSAGTRYRGRCRETTSMQSLRG
jgi:hypothetical protein